MCVANGAIFTGVFDQISVILKVAVKEVCKMWLLFCAE
jgi:hypothetical protein